MTKTVDDEILGDLLEYLRTSEQLHSCTLNWINGRNTLSLKLTSQLSIWEIVIIHYEYWNPNLESLFKIQTAKIFSSLTANPYIKELRLGMESTNSGQIPLRSLLIL